METGDGRWRHVASERCKASARGHTLFPQPSSSTRGTGSSLFIHRSFPPLSISLRSPCLKPPSLPRTASLRPRKRKSSMKFPVSRSVPAHPAAPLARLIAILYRRSSPATLPTPPRTRGLRLSLSPSRATCMHFTRALAWLTLILRPPRSSISAQVILRGSRSAGYGFVALATEAAAQKAVELLNKTELDGRPVIVEVAKPADQKEKKPKKTNNKRTNRRGDKAPPGEVTEAEANGEAEKAADSEAPAADEAAKPKKKKKSAVCLSLSSTGDTVLRRFLIAQA